MLYNLATYRIGAVTERSSHSIRRGLLSVAATGVEPERPGAWLKAWFSISFPYRKLGSGTKRTSPSGSPRKRNRRAVTGSEQNRGGGTPVERDVLGSGAALGDDQLLWWCPPLRPVGCGVGCLRAVSARGGGIEV